MGAATAATAQNKGATIQVPMLPASGMEAKCESPPPRAGRLRMASRKRDTDGLAAISRHNDGSMGKFSYSG